MSGLIVHEWVARSGGSERVVEEMLRAYPESDLFTLWNNAPDRFEINVRESWLARTPLRDRKVLSLPMMPAVWRSIPADRRYEWMLISSHLFAHHARVRNTPDIPKYVYAHTPARYIWAPEHDARGQGPLARSAATFLKPLDRHRAQEATAIAANSEFTRARIASYWGREASVLYPPVDVERIASVADWSTHLDTADSEVFASLPSSFVLGASRFVTYKRLDLVIDFAVANDTPAVLAGSGPDRGFLIDYARQSGANVVIVDDPSDELLFALYRRCLAFVFPAIEDFGIMPVEAMAAGAPVVVGPTGGATETVVENRSGTTVRDWSDQRELRDALASASRLGREAIRSRAWQFSRANFQQGLKAWVDGEAQ